MNYQYAMDTINQYKQSTREFINATLINVNKWRDSALAAARSTFVNMKAFVRAIPQMASQWLNWARESAVNTARWTRDWVFFLIAQISYGLTFAWNNLDKLPKLFMAFCNNVIETISSLFRGLWETIKFFGRLLKDIGRIVKNIAEFSWMLLKELPSFIWSLVPSFRDVMHVFRLVINAVLEIPRTLLRMLIKTKNLLIQFGHFCVDVLREIPDLLLSMVTFANQVAKNLYNISYAVGSYLLTTARDVFVSISGWVANKVGMGIGIGLAVGSLTMEGIGYLIKLLTPTSLFGGLGMSAQVPSSNSLEESTLTGLLVSTLNSADVKKPNVYVELEEMGVPSQVLPQFRAAANSDDEAELSDDLSSQPKQRATR